MPATTTLQPSVAAALMLAGRQLIAWDGWPSRETILSFTGACRSQAFVMAKRLRHTLAHLASKAGRPTTPEPDQDTLLALSLAVQKFLLENPGAATIGERGHYSDDFRRFIVELTGPGRPGQGLTVAQFSQAVAVPLGTLKIWLGQDPSPAEEQTPPETATSLHSTQIVTLFQKWRGSFPSFCKAVRTQHRLQYGDGYIAHLLHAAGVRERRPRKRKGAPWDRGTFQKLFPGAQWIGDGSSIVVQGVPVRWESETFVFNLELFIDAASNALTSVVVTDSEDQDAVLSALQNASAPLPLSLTLDNRPSNHTDAVAQTLAPTTTLLASTPYRPQSKAPIEGSIGLFKQDVPELAVFGATPRELARALAQLVVVAWARGRNGRPRKKLDGKTPAEYYLSYKPTDAEIVAGKREIAELQKRQELIRRTREARADKAKVEFLKEQLANFGISDPQNETAVCLAYYSRDAIANGVAIFAAKLTQGKVPDDALPERYLGGIIRNEDERLELELLAENFVRARLRLRDLSLEKLVSTAARIGGSQEERLDAYFRRALDATTTIDYQFWATKCCDALAEYHGTDRQDAYSRLARKISLSYKAKTDRKLALLEKLSRPFST